MSAKKPGSSARCRVVMFAAACLVSAAAGLVSVSQGAENREIAARRAAQRTAFSDAEITEGFFKIAFGAELHRAGRVDVIRKFVGPVRVFIDNRARPDRTEAVRRTLADIQKFIPQLDIATTDDAQNTNYRITIIREREFPATIARIYGRKQKSRILKSLEPQCLSGFSKDSEFRIIRSEIVLVADTDEFTFYDCAYEEMLQALGPINDDPSVPWTMFNDDVQMGFFDIYDQYLLNILYDPRIRAGMTKDEVRGIFPEVLKSARDRIAEANGLSR